MAISPSGLLATVSRDGSARFWDPVRRALVRVVEDPTFDSMYHVGWDARRRAFVLSGSSAATVDENGKVEQIETADIANARFIEPSEAAASWVTVSSAPQRLALMRADGCIATKLVPASEADDDAQVAFTADGAIVATLGEKGFDVWALREPARTPRHVAVVSHGRPSPFALKASGDAAYVLRSAPAKDSIRGTSHIDVVSLSNAASTHTLEGAIENVTYGGNEIALSRDGAFVAASTSQQMGVWDARTGKQLFTRDIASRRSKGARAATLVFVPGSPLLVVQEFERVYVLHAESGRLYGNLGSPRPGVDDAHFAGDQLLITQNRRMALWDLREAAVTTRHVVDEGHDLAAVGVTPQGDLLVAYTTRAFPSAPPWREPDPICDDDEHLLVEAWSGAKPPETKPVRAPKVTKASPRAWPPPPGTTAHYCVATPGRAWLSQIDLSHGRIRAGWARPNERAASIFGVYDLATDTTAVGGDDARASPGWRWRLGRGGQYGVNGVAREAAPGSRAFEVTIAAPPERASPASSCTAAPRSRGFEAKDVVSRDDSVWITTLDRVAVATSFATGKELYRFEADDVIDVLAFGAQASDVFVGTRSGKLSRHHDGTRVAIGDSSGQGLVSIDVDAAGTRVATVTRDGVVLIWDARTAALRASLVDFADDEQIAYTPAGAFAGTREAPERVVWAFDEPLEPFRFEQFARFRDPAT